MSTHNNTIPIVNGVDSTSEGDLLNLQEVTLFGNGITVSSGTDHLNITFSGSGYLEKLLTDDATSVTITCRAQSDAKYLTATILDNTETILSKRSIGYSAFPQKLVLSFSSGIGQVLRLEGTDAGVKLYNIHADAGLRTGGSQYLFIIQDADTSSSHYTGNGGGVVLTTELRLTTSTGQYIDFTDTSLLEGGASTWGTSVFRPKSGGAYVSWLSVPVDGTTSTIFDGIATGNGGNYASSSTHYPQNHKGKTYVILKLNTPVTITDVEWYTHQNNASAFLYGFQRVRVVGTNIDATALDDSIDIFDTDRETLLSSDYKLHVDRDNTTNMYNKPDATNDANWTDTDKYLVGWP